LGRNNEAKTAVSQLLKLKPGFMGQERQLISYYVKADGLAEKIIDGLEKAGIDDVK